MITTADSLTTLCAALNTMRNDNDIIKCISAIDKNDREIERDASALLRRRHHRYVIHSLRITQALYKEIASDLIGSGYGALATEIKIIETQIRELTLKFPDVH